MPWSPVPKFPEIIRLLNERGYKTQVNLAALRKAIIETTHLVKEKTIKQTIKIMVDLEYIRESTTSPFIWDIIYNKVEKTDAKVVENEADKLLENYGS